MAKLLIVEDNDENWDMLSRRLQRRDYDVVRAADGAQAVDMAQTEAPNLILMDMNLPIMDGWEATRQIRARPGGAAIPIISPDGARHVGRPREGAAGRVRRLPHQAGRASTTPDADRGATE